MRDSAAEKGEKASGRITRKKTFFWKTCRELSVNRYLYIMAIPVILYYIIFHYMPMYGAQIAFKEFDIGKGIWNSPWVGIKHFIDFTQGIYFWRLMRNTFLISLYQLLFSFPAPIILALLLNELRSDRLKRFVQTAVYLPHFISMVVICGMVLDFVSRTGVVVQVMALFGFEPVALMTKPQYFRPVYIISGIWQEIGWGSIIYLSALASIDQEQYEAATIDGAGRFKKMFYITLPGILPTITILLILRIGQVMNVGFEKIILLYNSSIYETADVISSFVYRRGLGESFQFSFTSAVGLFSSVINFILIISANHLSKKIGETSLW
jgi:putative aldouronate transport system permease protein